MELIFVIVAWGVRLYFGNIGFIYVAVGSFPELNVVRAGGEQIFRLFVDCQVSIRRSFWCEYNCTNHRFQFD